jgi:pyruvate kinase
MARRTKIVTTIGPASDSPAVLRRLVAAGMDVARIGLAHGTLDEALVRYRAVRAVSEEIGRPVGIMVDLPGPKVRLASFGSDPVLLATGSTVELVPGRPSSDASTLGVDYEDLLGDVHPGDLLAVGDGSVSLQIESVAATSATARVAHGGMTQGRPGLHVPSDRLRITSPTDEDLRFLDAFVDHGVDMVAVSFVRSAHDLRRLGTEPHPRGPLVIAKIETRAAVENLEGIIEAAGAIMIARGDLAVEIGFARTAEMQEEILWLCEAAHAPVIWATQVLETLAKSGTLSRAEITDAALGGRAECVMLNKGPHIVEAIRVLDNILQRMQAHQNKKRSMLRRLHWWNKSKATVKP